MDVTCPLVTGIFLRIVAEATEEDRMAGKSESTPYWRVVGEDGRLNQKFPGGMERQAERLRAERAYRRARKGYDRGKSRAGSMSLVIIMKIIRNVIN